MENEFHISGRGLTPGEPLGGPQIFAAERIEGRWERNFPSIRHSHSPWSAVTAFLQEIERNQEKPVSPLLP